MEGQQLQRRPRLAREKLSRNCCSCSLTAIGQQTSNCAVQAVRQDMIRQPAVHSSIGFLPCQCKLSMIPLLSCRVSWILRWIGMLGAVHMVMTPRSWKKV